MKPDEVKELAVTHPLTAKYLPALHNLAHTLSGKYGVPQDYEDFLQIAVIEAAALEERYDPQKGASFMTFVYRPITQVIQKSYGYPKSSTRLYNKVITVMQSYEDDFGILPTTEEIAKALKTTVTNITSLYMHKPTKVSLSLFEETEITTEDMLHQDVRIHNILEAIKESDRLLITQLFLEEYTPMTLAKLYNCTPEEITLRVHNIIEGVKKIIR